MNYKLLLPLLIILCISCKEETNQLIIENTPWGKETFSLPSFSEKIYSITDYEAKSVTAYNNQLLIQKAIDDCNDNGGGTVLIPEGVWETSYLELKSNVNLHLEKGAILSFLDSIPLYAIPTFTRWEGMECMNYHPLIYAKDQKNISISGEGKILGNGEAWWSMKKHTKKTLSKLYDQVEANIPPEERNCLDYDSTSYLRPSLVQFINCKNIHLDGFEIGSGPMWTIHLVYCENVVATNLNIITKGVNNDGIVPESSCKVLIDNCFFSTGDDCIVIKSGLNEDGWRVGKPSERIIIKNCETRRGHGGVVIGSEMSGGVKNIYAYDCDFNRTGRGIRVKSVKGRGGYIENLWFENIKMDSVNRAIQLNMNYKMGSITPRSDSIPVFRNSHFKNIISTNSNYCIGIYGMDEKNIMNLSFTNIRMTGKHGIRISNGLNLKFDSININSSNSVPLTIENTENAIFQNTNFKPSQDTMVVLSGINKDIKINNSNVEDFEIPFTEENLSGIVIK